MAERDTVSLRDVIVISGFTIAAGAGLGLAGVVLLNQQSDGAPALPTGVTNLPPTEDTIVIGTEIVEPTLGPWPSATLSLLTSEYTPDVSPTPSPTLPPTETLTPLKLTDILSLDRPLSLNIPVAENSQVTLINLAFTPVLNTEENRADFRVYEGDTGVVTLATGGNWVVEVHSGHHDGIPLPAEGLRKYLQGVLTFDDADEIPRQVDLVSHATGATLEQNGFVLPVEVKSLFVVPRDSMSVTVNGQVVVMPAIDYLRVHPINGQEQPSVASYIDKFATIVRALQLDVPIDEALRPDNNDVFIVFSLWGNGPDVWSSEVGVLWLRFGSPITP